MTTQTNPSKKLQVEYFGHCPTCHGAPDVILNLRRDHWACCHADKKRWCVGSNLFSSWREESEADWQRNYEQIKDYEDVESWHPHSTVGRPTTGKASCAICDGAAVPVGEFMFFGEGRPICIKCAKREASDLVELVQGADLIKRAKALFGLEKYCNVPF